jgi:hypothetical protein
MIKRAVSTESFALVAGSPANAKTKSVLRRKNIGGADGIAAAGVIPDPPGLLAGGGCWPPPAFGAVDAAALDGAPPPPPLPALAPVLTNAMASITQKPSFTYCIGHPLG